MSYLLTYLLTRVSSPRCSVSSSKSDCGRLLSGVFACFVRFFRHLVQIANTCISDFLLHHLSFLHTPLSHRFLFRPWFSVSLGCNSYFANHKRRKKTHIKKPPLRRLYARLPFEIGKAQLGSFPEMAP